MRRLSAKRAARGGAGLFARTMKALDIALQKHGRRLRLSARARLHQPHRSEPQRRQRRALYASAAVRACVAPASMSPSATARRAASGTPSSVAAPLLASLRGGIGAPRKSASLRASAGSQATCRAHAERSERVWRLCGTSVLLALSANSHQMRKGRELECYSFVCLKLSFLVCVFIPWRQPACRSLCGCRACPRQHPRQRVRQRMEHVVRPDPHVHAQHDIDLEA